MSADNEDAVKPQRLRFILLLCCMSTFLVQMDNTIVNVALPAIKMQFRPSLAGLQWVVDAYLLVLSSLLILAGSLGDKFGRKRIFLTGLMMFGLASLGCGMARSLHALVLFRMAQAVGGAMLNPSGMSLIGNIFVDAAERAKAFAVWGAVVGIGMACGPLIGGPLVQFFGWPAVFWINLPIVIVVAILVCFFVPESKAVKARRFDPVGQFLIILSLFLLVYSIVEFPMLAGRRFLLWVTALAAVLGFALLFAYERQRQQPLIDIRFFKSLPFSLSAMIAIINYACIGGFLFLNTLYLQEALGYSALKAGLWTVPVAVMTTVGAQLAGTMVARRGPLPPLAMAGGMLIAGVLLIILGDAYAHAPRLLLAYLLLGFAFGAANTPVNVIAMEGMPRSQAGVAGAIASSSRQTGQTLGVAITGALLAAAIHQNGVFDAAAMLSAWWVLLVSGALIIGLGLIATSRKARQSAQAMAALIQE